jgi:hypothetical protein
MTRSKTVPYSTSLDKPKCRRCTKEKAKGERERERREDAIEKERGVVPRWRF